MRLDSNNAPTTENSTQRLKFFALFISFDKIVWVYAREKICARKEALAQVYQELTGNNIESRLAYLGARITKI